MDKDTPIHKTYQQAGLHVFPVSMPSKAPAIAKGETWKVYNPQWVFNGSIAMGCGSSSGNIEAIDFDCKYALDDLMTNYFEAGGDVVKELYKKVAVQTTINGGFHFIYKCKTISGNKALARRPATPEELAVKPDEKIKVLIETRGEGGFIVTAPTHGYKIIQGDPLNFPEITPDEREILISTAVMLNEVWVDEPVYHKTDTAYGNGLTPWEDYNQRADVPALLQSHGWTYFRKSGQNEYYCRPGKSGAVSASWNESLRRFKVFSTSTEFEVKDGHAFCPSKLFYILECGGNSSVGAKKLIQMGYGETTAMTKHNTKQITISLPQGIAYNEITHGLTSDGKPISTKQMHDLWWNTANRPGFDSYYHQLMAIAPIWNPYEEFFKAKWSGVDQFEILKKYIDTDGGFIENLKRHIIRGINQLFGVPGSKTHHVNRYAFILQGGTHIGKSTLLRKVTLRDVLPGFSSEIDMGQSKTEVHRLLCQCVNLINEEIDSVTSQEIRNLKPIISYTGGALRLPYDRTPTTMQRIATLWGSVNPGEFLLETNDRWIVYEIRSIDFDYINGVDFEDMWRQCYSEWERNPLAGELNKTEVETISQNASKHLIVSPLEQFIQSHYEGDLNTSPVSLHDIRTEVIQYYAHVNDKQLGRVLTASFGKYKSGRVMVNGVRGTLYYVRRKR